MLLALYCWFHPIPYCMLSTIFHLQQKIHISSFPSIFGSIACNGLTFSSSLQTSTQNGDKFFTENSLVRYYYFLNIYMLYIIWIFRIEKPTFFNIKNVKYLFFIKNFFYSFFVLYLMKKIKSIFWNTIVFWYCFSFCVSFSDTFLYRFFSIPFSSLDNFLCFLLCFFFTTFLIVTISCFFLQAFLTL